MNISKKAVLSVSLFTLLLWGVVLSTYATPPSSPYTISDNITDPSCIPGGANCYVTAVTADNGLTATGSNVQLGGTLLQDTVVDGSGYTHSLEISGLSGAFLEADRDFFIQSNDRVVIRHAGDQIQVGGGRGVELTADANRPINFIFNPTNSDLRINSNPGTAGQVLTSGGPGVAPTWMTIPNSDWSLTGNSGTDSGVTNFLGTTDAQDLVFKTNNFEQMRIKSNGFIGFGTANPTGEFHMSKTTTGGYDIQSDSYGQQGTFTINRSSGTFAAPTRPGSGAILGTIGYGAYDSGTFTTTAKIIAAMDAATGAGDLPTALSFQTTPDGSATALERLRITNGGRLGLGTSNPSAFVQTINQITTGENAIFDRYGNTSGIQFRMAGGTLAAPTAIVSGNRIFRISGSGYNGSAFSNNRATIGAAATENWTTTANGTKLEFAVTATGSNILQTKATINENGLGINNSFPSANSAFVVGSGESFRVDDTGNLATINAVNYVWPSSQATGSGQVLTNDGSGNLTWAPGGGSVVSLIGSTNGLVSNPAPSGFTTETWLGYGAGAASASTNSTVFIGQNAGYAAINSYSASFIGSYAGQNSTAPNSTFVGFAAGNNAKASNSNFIGVGAGAGAVDITDSNFFGESAGSKTTNASFSNFIGFYAGAVDNISNLGSQKSANSIFIGKYAGYFAADNLLDNTNNIDDFSILIGNNTSTGGFSNSIALGANATNTASNQLQIGSTNRNISSVFIGNNKGTASTENTFFMGVNAGLNATNAEFSNFFGYAAGQNAINADKANFFGTNAGKDATLAYYSTFIGPSAGEGAADAHSAIFIGPNSGFYATSANDSIFLGPESGYLATNAEYSNFFGRDTGIGAENASNSNFIGHGVGTNAINALNSNFLGYNAGRDAENASQSNFIGQDAGNGAINARNSIFIGTYAGQGDSVNNNSSDDFSILIGKLTSTGGFKNSIAIGGSATNTATNQFMIGSTNRPINETRFQGSVIGTQCTITTGTGIACTSDERLKENIIDLSPTVLEDLMNIKTVHYNLISDTTHKPQIGFLAQNLEQYFPELVDTDRNSGFKSVYYAQMTPILVEAIREMNLKITDINNIETSNTWRDALIAWFENTGNGIRSLVVHDKICVDDQCLTKDDIKALLEIKNSNTPVPTSIPTIVPEENTPTDNALTCTDPQILNETGDACIDPEPAPVSEETPPTDTPYTEEPPTVTE